MSEKESKKCSKCHQVKWLTEFHQKGAGYRRSDCRECRREYQRKYYYEGGGREYHREYHESRKTNKRRFVSVIYSGARQRVDGTEYRSRICTGDLVRAKSALSYVGLEIMDRKEFVEWSLQDPWFTKLFDEWILSDCEHKLVPSIDRLDTRFGYIRGNVFWSTLSENSRAGSLARWGY